MNSNKNEAGIQLPLAFTFNASNQQVRTVIIDGQPYFVAKDVCDVLGHTNPSVAIQMLDYDERAKQCLGRQGETWVVNESGLYHLIFQSRKAEAKVFRKWVTSEVLPALRKTGRYEVCKAQPMRWSQRYVRPTSWLDLRNEPYETKMLYGGSVRVIVNEDVEWYSMGDVLRALGVGTCSIKAGGIWPARYTSSATLIRHGLPPLLAFASWRAAAVNICGCMIQFVKHQMPKNHGKDTQTLYGKRRRTVSPLCRDTGGAPRGAPGSLHEGVPSTAPRGTIRASGHR